MNAHLIVAKPISVIPALHQGQPMSEQTETILGVLGVVGMAGWSVLQWLQHTDKERHEDLKDAIEKQFAAAEQNRQLATDYWRDLFNEMRSGHVEIAERLEKLEERVAALEIDWIAKDDHVLRNYRGA